MQFVRGEEYDATLEINHIKSVLTKNQYKVSALALVSLDADPEMRDRGEERETEFSLRDLAQPGVRGPALVTLALMVLLQLSGHGVITFYTSLIFKVDIFGQFFVNTQCFLNLGRQCVTGP